MARRLGDRRWRSLALVGLALYTVLLIAAAFEHHDLSCELRTPQHCTSCATSHLGSDPDTSATLGVWHLADASRAVLIQPIADSILLSTHVTGRSPPAHS
jgi:hypothetical protein